MAKSKASGRYVHTVLCTSYAAASGLAPAAYILVDTATSIMLRVPFRQRYDDLQSLLNGVASCSSFDTCPDLSKQQVRPITSSRPDCSLSSLEDDHGCSAVRPPALVYPNPREPSPSRDRGLRSGRVARSTSILAARALTVIILRGLNRTDLLAGGEIAYLVKGLEPLTGTWSF